MSAIAPDVGGVEETAVWTLYHRAEEALRRNGIVDDPKAVEIYRRIDYPFRRRFGPPQRAFAVRTLAFDREVRAFLSSAPDGQVVGLGEGLETQRYRVDNGRVAWLTVDLPDGIRLRERFITPDARHRHLATDARDPGWMDLVDPARPCFIVAQGLLMYLPEREVRRLLQAVGHRLPGAWMLFDAMPAWLVRWTRLGLPAGPRYVAPAMSWSARESQRATFRRWVPSLAEAETVEYEYPSGFTRRALAGVRRWPALRAVMPTVFRLRFGPTDEPGAGEALRSVSDR